MGALGVLLVDGAEVGAGTVVGALLVHAEGVPCCGTENVGIRNVVHADGNAEDGAEGDEVGTDVAVFKSSGSEVNSTVVAFIASSPTSLVGSIPLL